jgi:hypothetical protein
MKSLFRKFFKSWFFEVSLVVVIILGGIYVLNVSIINTWVKQVIHDISGFYTQTSTAFKAIISDENSVKILIGLLAFILFLLILAYRIVWRLQGSKKFTATSCPRCSEPLVRVKSHEWQKKLRPILPLRRFYCRNCGWKGTRIKGNDNVPLNLQPGKPTRIHIDKIS